MRRSALLMTLWASTALAAEPTTLPTPLTPEQAVHIALGVAPSLDAQEASVRQARRDLGTGTVDFVPTLEFTGSYTRLSELDMPPFEFGGMTIDSPFQPILDNYSVKASLTWPVSDLFFAMIPAQNARADALRVQEAQQQVERNQVARSVLQSYYQLAQARAGITVAADGVEVLEAHVTQLRDLFQAGLVTRADLLATEAQLSEARAQHAQLLGAAETAEAHLASLLDAHGPIEVVFPEEVGITPPASDRASLVALAEQERPEIQLMDSLVDVHRHSAAAQRGAALPHLAVVGNLTYANPNQRVVPPTGEYFATWDATVALSWSPNESIKRGNAASQSRTDMIKAEADRETLMRSLDVQVASALSGLESSALMARASSEQATAAEAAFDAQSDLLEAGSATSTETLQAEASARRARHAELQARIDLILADVELKYALGTLLASDMENN